MLLPVLAVNGLSIWGEAEVTGNNRPEADDHYFRFEAMPAANTRDCARYVRSHLNNAINYLV